MRPPRCSRASRWTACAPRPAPPSGRRRRRHRRCDRRLRHRARCRPEPAGKVSTVRTSPRSAMTRTFATSTPSGTARTWPASSPADDPRSGLRRHRSRRADRQRQGRRPRRLDLAREPARRDRLDRPQRQPAGLNIRVLNLAFGAAATAATERTRSPRRRGGVEARASSSSPPPATAARTTASADSPAYDPYVIAVGAEDTPGTADQADDLVADFSSRGAATRPRRGRPRRRIMSLRVRRASSTSVPAGPDRRTAFRGSGTSQSTAVGVRRVGAAAPGPPATLPDELKAVAARRGATRRRA